MANSNIGLVFSEGNKYLKSRFVDNDFRDAQTYGESPMFRDIYSQPKSGLKPGENIVYPIKVSRTNHTSPNFSDAQNAAKSRTGTRERFTIPYDAEYYDVGRIGSKAIGASKESVGAFVDLLDDEVMDVYESVTGAIGGGLFRSDMYLLGETAAGGGVTTATKTVQLAAGAALLELEVGMEIDAVSSAATTTKLGSYTIVSIDRNSRKIVLNIVTDLLTSGSNKNQFYYKGAESSTPKMASIRDFLPGSVTSANKTLFGVDRSADVVRLGGVVYTASATDTIVEALQKASVKTFQYYRGFQTKMPKKIDCWYVSPIAHQLLVDELDSKVRYNKSSNVASGDERAVGFADIGIYAGGHYIPVKSDPNQLNGQAFGLNLKTWAINWIGTGPKNKGPVHLFPLPEGGYLKTAHDGAGVEARVQAFPSLGCFAPGLNARVDLNAITKIGTYLT